MDDGDYLNSQLEGSKENIELRVNEIESQIMKDLADDWRQTETRIIEDQHHRNRTIVQEIIKTCDKFKKEISKKQIKRANLYIDNEVDAIEKEKNPYA
jgi:hypothetical protein